MTGLACPTCGGTHALVSLTQGRLLAAFAENPGVVIAGLAFGVWVLWGLVAMAWTRLRIAVVLTPREKRALRLAVLVLFLGTWLWEICRLTL